MMVKFLRTILFFLLPLFLLSTSGCHSKKINEKQVADSVSKIPDPSTRIIVLDKFLKDNPKSALLLHQQAVAYSEVGNIDKALDAAKSTIENDSTNADYYFFMADLFMKKPSVKNALNTMDRLTVSQPKNKMAFVKIGELYVLSGKNEESLKSLENALKIDPNIPEAYFWRAYNFKEMKKYDKAIANFQKAVELKPDYGEAYVLLGILSADKKDPKAAEYYSTAIRINPKDTQALFDRGNYYKDIDSFQKAIDDYNKILELDPSRRSANYAIGYCLYSMGKYSDALGFFSKVLLNNPKDAAAHLSRGQCYKAMGEFDKARKEQEIYDRLTAEEKGK